MSTPTAAAPSSQTRRSHATAATGSPTSRRLFFAFRNVITGNHGYGIWNFDWGADIENNQVNNNGADGIYIGPDIDSPDTWTLLNNTANQNGGHGINFQGHFGNPPWIWPPVTFEGNRASGNQTPPQCVNIFCRTS